MGRPSRVAIGPKTPSTPAGHTVFAQMPNGSSSIVTARIRPTMPAFAAQ
jgi:hypothetical protein